PHLLGRRAPARARLEPPPDPRGQRRRVRRLAAPPGEHRGRTRLRRADDEGDERAAEGRVVIITQTPLRISFAGGGTDLAAYYAQREGFVVSTAIDKFVYVIVKERFDDAIYLNTMKKEIRESVDEIEHELVREAMRVA